MCVQEIRSSGYPSFFFRLLLDESERPSGSGKQGGCSGQWEGVAIADSEKRGPDAIFLLRSFLPPTPPLFPLNRTAMSAQHSIVSEPEFERESSRPASQSLVLPKWRRFRYSAQSRLDRVDRSLTCCSPLSSLLIPLLALAVRPLLLLIIFQRPSRKSNPPSPPSSLNDRSSSEPSRVRFHPHTTLNANAERGFFVPASVLQVPERIIQVHTPPLRSACVLHADLARSDSSESSGKTTRCAFVSPVRGTTRSLLSLVIS